MSYAPEKDLFYEAICLYHDMPLAVLGKLSTKGYFKEFHQPDLSPIEVDLNCIGVVYTEMTALKKGVVRLDARWWFALSNSHMAIHPGQQVRVTDLQSCTLLVEQYQCK
ncbi:NfeD family protein [Leptothoe spongobia]|uniref:NfeD family protein n=1 Tax=Leptothoe spongobia TAU-MAC 1115 TaxID=1967444 RepID=A0A947GJV6_9CYAN|nr:NfeD family protein [Leptothoe spongobia]MBT9317335.1 NfeD family protein [Leptothoe spongobia TAU-MAC 1115]